MDFTQYYCHWVSYQYSFRKEVIIESSFYGIYSHDVASVYVYFGVSYRYSYPYDLFYSRQFFYGSLRFIIFCCIINFKPRSLGFQNYHIIPTINYCGGIWVLWNNQDYKFSIWFENHRIVISKVLDLQDNFEFYCIGIYASAQNHEKESFWLSLIDLLLGLDFPWVLIGDFNDLLSSEEKLGRRVLPLSAYDCLKFVLSQLEAMDVPHNGSSFTWKKNLQGYVIYEKLDQAFMHLEWFQHYQDTYLYIEYFSVF